MASDHFLSSKAPPKATDMDVDVSLSINNDVVDSDDVDVVDTLIRLANTDNMIPLNQ